MQMSAAGTVASGAMAGGLSAPLSGSTRASMSQRRAPEFDSDLHFLFHRITQGFAIPDWFEAEALGYDAFLESQLDYTNIDDSQLENSLTQFPSLTMPIWDLLSEYRTRPNAVYAELQYATLLRSIASKRLLFERMVEFWTDHFNIDHDLETQKYYKTPDDRDVIRQHALGNFKDLLRASAHSPAMLSYLNNDVNTAEAPNENYGRELMELHTLGVDGPYEEFDVKNVARCFTGWTIKTERRDPERGSFVFDPSIHDNDQKIVLGVVIPPFGGETDGDMVLDILADHPKTADFVARKMTRWFLGDNPPEAAVRSAAHAYRQTGGDIKSMIRAILRPHHVRPPAGQQIDPFAGIKFRRPLHFFYSLMRAVRPKIDGRRGYRSIIDHLHELSQIPMDYGTPDGYPDHVNAWVLTLLPRWHFASDLLANRITNVEVDPLVVIPRLGQFTFETLGEAINRLLTGGAMPPGDVAEIQNFIEARSSSFQWPVVAEAIALAASSPGYQYY